MILLKSLSIWGQMDKNITERSEITYVFSEQYSFNIVVYKKFLTWYNSSEMETKKWMASNIKGDWNIVDAGANIGMYTLPFSMLANSGRIFAFEPTDTIDILKENLNRYNVSNVTLINAPLGSKTEKKQDNIYKIWEEAPENRTYDFITIDDYFDGQNVEKIDLIKIDVDSYDYEVLLGAENVLKKYSPLVIVELNHALFLRNHNPKEAIQWMLSQGYNNPICLDGENYFFRR